MEATGQTLDEVLHTLANQGGLLGISGISSDLRDVEREYANGNDRARLAVEVYCYQIRKYIGAYAVALGALKIEAADSAAFLEKLNAVIADIAATRPTARNLFFALERMKQAAAAGAGSAPSACAASSAMPGINGRSSIRQPLAPR